MTNNQNNNSIRDKSIYIYIFLLYYLFSFDQSPYFADYANYLPITFDQKWKAYIYTEFYY